MPLCPSGSRLIRALGVRGPRALLACVPLIAACGGPRESSAVTVPFILDHNRMLVDAEIRHPDGAWRPVRLWVDSGNPEFFIRESLAQDLRIDLSTAATAADGSRPPLEVPPPTAIRIGGMELDFTGVKSKVMFEPHWLFDTMHNDANLPATALRRYQVVFDYPRRTFTLGAPGSIVHRGVRAEASVCAATGIVQIDAVIDRDSLSLALDNGASYSFISGEVLARHCERHPEWPRHTGALGAANMWGWTPREAEWPMARIRALSWGPIPLTELGVVGWPGIGAWYSQKTARPVDGFLGANALKAFRVEIDYAGGAVYFEKCADADACDMDLVGLTLRLEPDGAYRVVGVSAKDGHPSVDAVQPGDALLEIDALRTSGATMGTVVDALRGKPGDVHTLVIEREGERRTVAGRVERFL